MNENINSKSATELYNKCQSEFMAMRAKQEMMVQNFFESLDKIDKDFFKDVEIPEQRTLKELVPEYYVENPRQAVLDEQIEHVNEIFAKISNIFMNELEEAIKCYSSYQVLASNEH